MYSRSRKFITLPFVPPIFVLWIEANVIRTPYLTKGHAIDGVILVVNPCVPWTRKFDVFFS